MTEKKTNSDTLYVISVISNPIKYQTRYKLFTEFCERLGKEKNIKLVTLELQQNHREFVTNSCIKINKL